MLHAKVLFIQRREKNWEKYFTAVLLKGSNLKGDIIK